MSVRVVAEQIFWVTASRLLSRGSLIATSIILARSLVVEDYAAFNFFSLTILMLATYAALGLGVTSNRFFVGADQLEGDQSRTIAAIISISFGFAVISTLAILLVPEKLLLGELSISRWWIASGIFILSLEVVPNNAMAGMERYRQDTILSAVSGCFTIFTGIYAAREQSLELAMIALIGGSLLRVVGGTGVLIRAIGWRQIVSGFPFSRRDAVRIFNFSLPMFLVSLLSSTGPWVVGRIVLSSDGGAHALAIFTIGLQWFSLAMFLPASVSRISVPRLVRSIERPAPSDPVKKHVMFGLKLSVLSSSTVAVLGLVFSEHIMALYGNNYSVDKWFLGTFLFVAVLASISQMMGNLIVFSDQQWGWLIISLFFVLTMIFTAYLVTNKGVWIGPFSFLAAYCVLLSLSASFIKQRNLLKNRVAT